MIEMMFGSGSPMWAAMPSAGIAYQPGGFSSRPLATPVFSSPVIAGGIGGGSSVAQGLPLPAAPSPTIYSYGGGIGPGAQQNLAVPGLAIASPFASNLLGVPIADAAGIVTAASLLASVAMRRGQPQGPTNDAEVEEFVYDALDLLPGAAEVEIRCEGGRVTLTGSVPHKRAKRDVGELAWAIPGLHDVQNNVSITPRRRGRAAGREAETPAGVSGRKQG
jgi:hypothetical protein